MAAPDGAASWGDPSAPAAAASVANGGGAWEAWQPNQGYANYDAGADAAPATASGAAAAGDHTASDGGGTGWSSWSWYSWPQSGYYNSWSDWNNRASGNEDKFEKDDNDVPVWDGNVNKMSVLTYFRKIDLWVAQTKTSAARRGPKLLMKLEGSAFEKLTSVKPADLSTNDGVDKFKNIILNKFEPIERYRVGKIMDLFLYNFPKTR